MIVCAKCGERSAGTTRFCPGCGSFLDWSGTDAEQQAQAVPATEPARQSAAAGTTTTAPPVGPSGVVTPDPIGPQQSAEPTPPVTQFGAQQPADARPLRAKAQGTEPRALAEDDVVCVGCRTRNPATRTLCMGCGRPLDEPEAVKPPWWQWWRGRDRERKPRKPRRRGTLAAIGRWLRRVFLAFLAVLAVLYAIIPGFRSGVNQEVLAGRKWVERQFSTQLTPVRPTKVSATAALPGHEAVLVADNAKNTYWAAPTAATPPVLVFTFAQPVDLRRAIVRVGDPAAFQATHRPAKLHLVYSTGKTFDVPLADTPDPQTVEIGGSAGATEVEIHVVEVHRSLQGLDVAMSEIELFEQR
ncbi:NADase-type glycan-binding domain-containing protein [Actinokineospora globicatena]|uniref:Zinc ribbon domain-containing protein n=1 Tax=Actinokineospora globicatena TaxID=103729 RepID=A0A9W6QJ00_9PSEU|nr:zinc ribbon domain-containing protein [Actinokineospora globicatena]GLW89474.1 zinc ribbon domain-containing protein [Actinokineospora globicatena]